MAAFLSDCVQCLDIAKGEHKFLLYCGYVADVSPQEQWGNIPVIGKLQILRSSTTAVAAAEYGRPYLYGLRFFANKPYLYASIDRICYCYVITVLLKVSISAVTLDYRYICYVITVLLKVSISAVITRP